MCAAYPIFRSIPLSINFMPSRFKSTGFFIVSGYGTRGKFSAAADKWFEEQTTRPRNKTRRVRY
jgi:hypothetical protein